MYIYYVRTSHGCDIIHKKEKLKVQTLHRSSADAGINQKNIALILDARWRELYAHFFLKKNIGKIPYTSLCSPHLLKEREKYTYEEDKRWVKHKKTDKNKKKGETYFPIMWPI